MVLESLINPRWDSLVSIVVLRSESPTLDVCVSHTFLLSAFTLFLHFASRPRQQVTQWPHRACPLDGKRGRTQREELTMSTTTTGPPHGRGQSCRYIRSAGQHDCEIWLQVFLHPTFLCSSWKHDRPQHFTLLPTSKTIVKKKNALIWTPA